MGRGISVNIIKMKKHTADISLFTSLNRILSPLLQIRETVSNSIGRYKIDLGSFSMPFFVISSKIAKCTISKPQMERSLDA
jgi:hypothetical protein